MALNDEQKWKGAPYQMRPTTPYKMEAPAPVVQRVVPAVEKPAAAPIRPAPAKPKPGAFARGVADTVAFAGDAVMAPSKALADGVNRAAVGVLNVGRQGVGMAPVQPREFNYTATQDKLAAVRAQNQAAQQPAVAAPRVKFAGTDAMPDSMFRSPIQQPPQRLSPSQRMTDDQANAAEVNARTATQTPTSPPTGVGASVGAGGAAPIRPGDLNTFTGTNGVTRRVPMPGTIDAATNQSGSVQSQNFGNPVVPQAQASIAQPRVASTFGLGVNDPRLNDQTPAIASPNAAARGFGLASADGTSRYYANKEDREAAKKLYDSMDTEAFRLSMAANNPGRRGRQAMETLSALRGQQAKLIGDQANNTAAQISDNTRGQFTLANTGMEQSGQTQRQQMAGDVAREGNFLDYDAKNRATDASLIEKPQYVTDAQGRYLRVGADGAAPVTDASGAAIQMPPPAQAQQRDYQAEAFNSLVSDLLDGQRDMAGNLPPNAVENAIAQAQKVQAARQPQGGGVQTATNPKTGEKMRKNPQTGVWEPIK